MAPRLLAWASDFFVDHFFVSWSLIRHSAIDNSSIPGGIFRKTKFSKPIYEAAARNLVNTGGGVFSHPVGMAVHDDGDYTRGPLKVGQVFSIDPQLWVRDLNLYFSYEDVVVVTETGYENFTDFLPVERARIRQLK